MAFEDDMIDAGFSDEMSYLDYLMDEGERIMSRVAETFNLDNYDPDDEYDIIMHDRIESRKNIPRVKAFQSWANNNPTYFKWQIKYKQKLIKHIWDIMKRYFWSWEMRPEWRDSDSIGYIDLDEDFYNCTIDGYYYAWKNTFRRQAPNILHDLYTDWQKLYSYDKSGNLVMSKETALLSEYTTHHDKIIREKLRNKYGNDTISSCLQYSAKPKEIEQIIGSKLVRLCFKNTCLLSTLDDKKQFNDSVIERLLCDLELSLNRKGWFNLSKTEDVLLSELFQYEAFQSYSFENNNYAWLQDYYFVMLAWMKRIDSHLEEIESIFESRKKLVYPCVFSRGYKEFIKISKIFEYDLSSDFCEKNLIALWKVAMVSQ